MDIIIFEFSFPTPKFQTLFQYRETNGDIENHVQIDTGSGRLSSGKVKYWLSLGKLLLLPVRNAL